MSQHLVGLAEVAQFLGIVSRGKRPGNRLWELMRAGRLKQFPHVRIGRTVSRTGVGTGGICSVVIISAVARVGADVTVGDRERAVRVGVTARVVRCSGKACVAEVLRATIVRVGLAARFARTKP